MSGVSRNLVLDVHQLQDGGAVVRDRHVAVGRLEHLVHPLRPERRAQHGRDRARRDDVGLRSTRIASARENTNAQPRGVAQRARTRFAAAAGIPIVRLNPQNWTTSVYQKSDICAEHRAGLYL